MTPEPGQYWADNDSRHTGRIVRIVSVDSTYAVVDVVRAARWSVTQRLQRGIQIRLDRFRPTSTGYRRVEAP